MDAIAVAFSVAVLALLVAAVVRRSVLADLRTARRAGMASTSPDRRRPSARLLLLAHVALGLFAVALALYLLVAAWPGLEVSTTYGARLVMRLGAGGHPGGRRHVLGRQPARGRAREAR